MSYAGMYDPSPVPQPKRTPPKWDLLLACGHIGQREPYWSSDPLYGGWQPPAFAFCKTCWDTVSVRRRADRARVLPPADRSET